MIIFDGIINKFNVRIVALVFFCFVLLLFIVICIDVTIIDVVFTSELEPNQSYNRS